MAVVDSSEDMIGLLNLREAELELCGSELAINALLVKVSNPDTVVSPKYPNGPTSFPGNVSFGLSFGHT